MEEKTTTETQKVKLPLYKQSERFKMIIPVQVEQKIRLACASLPKQEWSGVLFYKYKGGFETHDLKIAVQDILVMDVGNATYTEWSADADVIAYICENELYGCQLGIIHSHNSMATFFSGTDIATLNEEGTDRNNIVSLIVNNDGTYNAAITRRCTAVGRVKETVSYPFFGEGDLSFEDEYDTEETYLEYYHFDIVRKAPKGVLGFLDRLKEIMNKPKPAPKYGYNSAGFGYGVGSGGYNKPASAPAKPTEPVKPAPIQVEADHSKPVTTIATPPTTKIEPTKFNDSLFPETAPIDEPKKELTDPIIETYCRQLLTGDIFSMNDGFDLDEWVTNKMYDRYKLRFGTDVSAKSEFHAWFDNILEYFLFGALVPELEDFPSGDKSSILAEMMYERIDRIDFSCVYLNEILKSLKHYIDD